MRRLVLALALSAVSACGGDSKDSSTPTTPTPPTPAPAQNRSPQITAMTVTPAFGIAFLTSFSFSASATDADGDTLSYSWDLAGTSFSGTSGTTVFTNGFSGEARLTVSDGKGGSATDTRGFVVGSMSGQWIGTVDVTGCTGRVKALSASLSQNQTVVTGSIGLPEGLCSFAGGTAITDPAEPGRIDANGNVQIRIKVPPFTDVTFRGVMDQTGRRVSGGLFGSGHTGTPVVLNKL